MPVTLVTHVVGARPNFMKMAPVYLALREVPGLSQRVVHSGQHYDARMSDVFFEQLQLPWPDSNLAVGSGSHASQTADVLVRFEQELLAHPAQWVFVYGDVNSTIAAALTAKKLGVKVAHVEAGLRSHDWGMPEEINRVLTDRISDLLFTPSPDADENLRAEGVPLAAIQRVGNCMIDTLVRLLPSAVAPERFSQLGSPRRYVLATFHRPSNVDDPALLARLMTALSRIAESTPVLFPVHPRTRQRLHAGGLLPEATSRVQLMDPLGYLEFMWLQKHASAIATDSGGIQEEATYLRVPCFTMRDNTERPITCTEGSNTLVGKSPERLAECICAELTTASSPRACPELWDGAAGKRIAEIFARRIMADQNSESQISESQGVAS
jgi:UDP-N-acetylglucosamine 2-epimerase (non-hydrolysing)